jgi:TetR/AcrR family transcriptional regulator, transcriptional repressor for nem operon
MRYDSEHKARTRARLLQEAAATLRAVGPNGIGIAGLMAKVGLTHGGFYAHFKSKDDLVAAAVDGMFGDSRAMFESRTQGHTPADGLARYIDAYLSAQHRDRTDHGCPLPCLSGELARLPGPARDRFAQGASGLARQIAGLLEKLGTPDAEPAAVSMVSEMVGALALARVEPDRDQSDRILRASREGLKRRLGVA